MEISESGKEGGGDGGTDEDGKYPEKSSVTPVRYSTNSGYHVCENGSSERKKIRKNGDDAGSISKKLKERISFYERVWSKNNNDSSLLDESADDSKTKSAGGVGRYKNIYTAYISFWKSMEE